MSGKINPNPGPKEIYYFGLTILIGFGIIGGLLFRAGRVSSAALVWGISGLVAIFAFAFPSKSKPVYKAWMMLGLAIGAVTSRIILAIIFFGIVTPVALFFRLRGRDSLGLKKRDGSQWCPHPKIDDSNFEHMF
jgi:hypothetical protein